MSSARRRIKDLTRLHLLRTELGRPNAFVIANPTSAVDGLLTEARAELDSKVKVADGLQGEMARLSEVVVEGAKAAGVPSSYHLVRGRDQFLRESRGFCRKAEKELLLMLPSGAINVIANGVMEDFNGCIVRGALIRVITEICDSNLLEGLQLAEIARIRNHRFIPLEMHIWNRKAVCFGAIKESAAGADRTDDPYLVIVDPFLAGAMASVFEAM